MCIDCNQCLSSVNIVCDYCELSVISTCLAVAALGVGNQGGCPGRQLLGGRQKPKIRSQIGIKPLILLKSILRTLKIYKEIGVKKPFAQVPLQQKAGSGFWYYDILIVALTL